MFFIQVPRFDNGHKILKQQWFPEDFNPYSFLHLGHNQFPATMDIKGTYAAIKHVLLLERDEKKHVLVHCKKLSLHVLKQRVQKKTQFEKQNLLNQVCSQWSFICVDLIGEFLSSPLQKVIDYTLNCCLYAYRVSHFCIPIKNKGQHKRLFTAWRKSYFHFLFGVCRKVY